jgi:hypothetical protein
VMVWSKILCTSASGSSPALMALCVAGMPSASAWASRSLKSWKPSQPMPVQNRITVG